MINWEDHGHRDGAVGLSGLAMSGRRYQVSGPETGVEAVAWGALVSEPGELPDGAFLEIARGVTRDEAVEACLCHEGRLCVEEARSIARDALAFRGRMPLSDGEGAWRAEARSLIGRVTEIDLDVPGVRAAVEEEVSLAAARPADVLTAEAFIERVRKDARGLQLIEWREIEEIWPEHLTYAYGEGPPGAGGVRREYHVSASDETGATWGGGRYPDGPGGPDLAQGVSREEAMTACERYEANLWVQEARSFAREALAFRGRWPSSDDHAQWREAAKSLLARAGRLDLDVPGIRAAIEAEVALAAARPEDVLTAEAFVGRVQTKTHRRLAMADLAEARMQRRALGQGFRA
ncbi:MAG: hypothetical protein OXD40_05710 [bacterium]|nr:hypothetical protein [bacterium]